MFIMYLLEILAVFVFGILIISQIIIPSFEGRKIFPMFTKLSKMEAVEVELRQKVIEETKQHSINNIMKDVK